MGLVERGRAGMVGASMALVFTVGGVQVWRHDDYCVVWCTRCAARKGVAFVDARVEDAILRELAEWHAAKFHGGEAS